METPALPDTLPESLAEALDRFPRGKVVKFFPELRYGFIRDRNGRDVYFNLDEVRFVGPKDHRDLREGRGVGYDVSWTSHGRHVTYLKID